MTPQTFIFIGRSGSGKGTQVKLLEKYITENDPVKRSIFYLETGERFRNFIAGDSYASFLSKEISKRGELQPEFLAVYMWAEELINKLKHDEHLIIDGSPRRLREAMVLDTALSFFKRQNPIVIDLNVSPEWSRERLIARGRADDVQKEDIEKRLKWFNLEVRPAIDWFGNQPGYKIFHINGEQTIEQVHEDIISAIFNS
ncbi:MAG: nucleoside monophosphate kinase [Patescibacteria group bacterium]